MLARFPWLCRHAGCSHSEKASSTRRPIKLQCRLNMIDKWGCTACTYLHFRCKKLCFQPRYTSDLRFGARAELPLSQESWATNCLPDLAALSAETHSSLILAGRVIFEFRVINYQAYRAMTAAAISISREKPIIDLPVYARQPNACGQPKLTIRKDHNSSSIRRDRRPKTSRGSLVSNASKRPNEHSTCLPPQIRSVLPKPSQPPDKHVL